MDGQNEEVKRTHVSFIAHFLSICWAAAIFFAVGKYVGMRHLTALPIWAGIVFVIFMLGHKAINRLFEKWPQEYDLLKHFLAVWFTAGAFLFFGYYWGQSSWGKFSIVAGIYLVIVGTIVVRRSWDKLPWSKSRSSLPIKLQPAHYRHAVPDEPRELVLVALVAPLAESSATSKGLSRAAHIAILIWTAVCFWVLGVLMKMPLRSELYWWSAAVVVLSVFAFGSVIIREYLPCIDNQPVSFMDQFLWLVIVGFIFLVSGYRLLESSDPTLREAVSIGLLLVVLLMNRPSNEEDLKI